MPTARRILFLFLAAAPAAAGCGPAPATGPAHAAMPDMPGHDMSAHAARPDEPAATPAAHQIVIDNFSFSPAELTVSAGAEVTWVNHDDVPHTATSTVKPRAFDSGALDTDQTYSHVFTTPGEYEYFCAVHPHMTGRVVVK